MKFADRWSMRAELLEAREDEYDEIVDKDPKIQALYERVDGYLGCIRNALLKGGASSEAIEALDKLEESIYVIVSEVIENLAEEAHVETYIAYQVGLHYEKLLNNKKADRDLQDGEELD